MLGEQIGESRGRRGGRRIISVDAGFKAEVSFEDQGKMLGIDGGTIGTYCSTPRPDGTLLGEGQGVFLTRDGEMASWKGIATGRFTGGGAVHYSGALIYNTTSKKLAKLNTISGVFEFDVDSEGNTQSKVWEWK